MSGKIKVLECIRQGQIGGGESHLLSLVENLDRETFEPVVLSFTPGPMVDRLKAMEVKTNVIYTERPFDFTKWRKVRKFIKDNGVNLVHAHGSRANSNILWAAHSLKIPVIYTVHGWSFHQDQPAVLRKIRIMGEKYLTQRSDLVISVSASNQQTGREFIKSFDSVVVTNGINLSKFNPANSFKNIRRELGIAEQTILVLFIARFTSHKQPLSLIRAFQTALDRFPGMHLLMVGEGDERAAAEQLIAGFKLEKSVTLLPFRQDVPDVLAAADIFVLPSLWEGLPIGLLEAMAMGKAVIATNVDGSREVVQHDRNGVLVETGNLVPDLSAALVDLAGNAEKRNRYGKEALDTVSTRYSAKEMTRQIEGLYKQVLRNKN
ncbi:MAG: glycosyltransferase family 4 protein [Sphingobacteriales bacterium]|nr:glycosyltransferase family 4 protein [Sphingobacteriales bacterium]